MTFIKVVLLTICSFGFYPVYLLKTKMDEQNRLLAEQNEYLKVLVHK